MNLKGKNTTIPHGQPGILIPLDRAARDDLSRGRGKFDWWRLDVGDPASNQHDSKSSNHYTTAPLVINQAQLD